MLKGTIGWLVGVGLLLLGALHALLALKAGPLIAVAAGAYLVGGLTSLPPTGPAFLRSVFKDDSDQRQLWIVFLCSAVGIGLMALDARGDMPGP